MARRIQKRSRSYNLSSDLSLASSRVSPPSTHYPLTASMSSFPSRTLQSVSESSPVHLTTGPLAGVKSLQGSSKYSLHDAGVASRVSECQVLSRLTVRNYPPKIYTQTVSAPLTGSSTFSASLLQRHVPDPIAQHHHHWRLHLPGRRHRSSDIISKTDENNESRDKTSLHIRQKVLKTTTESDDAVSKRIRRRLRNINISDSGSAKVEKSKRDERVNHRNSAESGRQSREKSSELFPRKEDDSTENENKIRPQRHCQVVEGKEISAASKTYPKQTTTTREISDSVSREDSGFVDSEVTVKVKDSSDGQETWRSSKESDTSSGMASRDRSGEATSLTRKRETIPIITTDDYSEEPEDSVSNYLPYSSITPDLTVLISGVLIS